MDTPARDRVNRPPVGAADLARFETFWRDEVAAAALYRDLAGLVDGGRRSLLRELAAAEERHAAHWAAILEEQGRELVEPPRPWRHRVLLVVARRFGVDRVLPAVVRAEAADRDRYRASVHAAPGMAEEETAHGRALALASTDNVGEGSRWPTPATAHRRAGHCVRRCSAPTMGWCRTSR